MKMTADFLEHYGVKGMRWGVRKDDDPASNILSRLSKKQNGSRNREVASNEQMDMIMSNLYSAAKSSYDSSIPHGAVLSAEERKAKWLEAYKAVLSSSPQWQQELVAAYQLLKELGLADRFSVAVQGDSSSKESELVVIFYDTKEGDYLDTIKECLERKKKDNKLSRGREKNVVNTEPVAVNKRKANVYGGTGYANPESMLNGNQIKHSIINVKDDNIFLEHYGVKGQKWGVRRTPEQLGHRGESVIKRITKKMKQASQKKKKKQEKVKQESDDEIRQKVLKSVDPKYIYKHRALLDDRELQGRIDRINKETTLKKMAEPGDKAYNIAKKGDNWLKTASSMSKSVSEIYTAMNVINSIAQKGVNKNASSTVNINVGGKKDKKKDKKDDNK